MNAQTRILRLIEVLAGNEVSGMRLVDIAAALGDAPHASTALRDLKTLEDSGWAQQLPDNRWRLSAKPIQILHYFNLGLARAAESVNETRANYTRTPVHYRSMS